MKVVRGTVLAVGAKLMRSCNQLSSRCWSGLCLVGILTLAWPTLFPARGGDPQPVISEFLASNRSGLKDEDGDYDGLKDFDAIYAGEDVD